MQIASQMNLLQSGLASAERVFEFLAPDEEAPDATGCRHSSPRPATSSSITSPSATSPTSPSSRTSTSTSSRGRRWPSSARPGPARPRWSTCSCASTRSTPGTSTSTARIPRDAPRRRSAACSGWSSRTPGCSPAPSGTTSPTARRAPAEDEIDRAATAAHVDHFVRTLPEGYDTLLDDDASATSPQGERQLLTIARAFLADPAILILDEATSNVDTRTEVLIQEAMARLRQDGRASSSPTGCRRSATRIRSWS